MTLNSIRCCLTKGILNTPLLRLGGTRNMATNPEKLHNASPKLPLLYYKASKRAMESINHRVFYANWIFVFAAYDFFTTFVDF